MNDRIDERKVNRYLYEIAGRAGTSCQHSDLWEEPEYNQAMWLYLTLPHTELEARLAPTRENVVHPSGAVIQWNTYCRMEERAYKREYLKSDQWKRKRDAVMARARFNANRDLPPKIPNNPVIKRTVDRYGRVIKSIETEEYGPICENEGCTNEAKQVHHLTYERIGKEHLEDLQALCPECHMQKS